MKILMIGGNGFIGKNLVKFLEGQQVQIYDISPCLFQGNYEYIQGDFFDDIELFKVVDEADYIVHALSTMNPSNSNPKYLMGYSRDLIQTVKLCERVSKSRKGMLFLSSGGTVYGEQSIQPIPENAKLQPINHYGNVKVAIENAINVFNRHNHSNIRIARISNPYGPGQNFEKGVGFIDAVLKKAMAGESIEIWGKGNIIRDYIYIDDVCNMLKAIIEYKGEENVFNVGTGVGTSQKSVIDIVETLGLKADVHYAEARDVDVQTSILDNRRIRALYHNELCGIEDGINKYYMYLNNN